MEKLERVLVAEEDAREALADARVESTHLRAAARDEARRIEKDSARCCDADMASERAATLTEAQAEADRIIRESRDRRDRTALAARGRLDDAVRRIATSLEA